MSVNRHTFNGYTSRSRRNSFSKGSDARWHKKCWLGKKERRKKRKRGKGLGCALKGRFNWKEGTGLLFIPGNGKLTRKKRTKSPRDVPLFRLPSLRRSNEWLKCTLRHVEFNDVKKVAELCCAFQRIKDETGNVNPVFWSRESRHVICTRLFSVSGCLLQRSWEETFNFSQFFDVIKIVIKKILGRIDI